MTQFTHEKLFERAFHFAAVGMALVGLDGRWVRVNRSLCVSLGYAEEELLRLTFQDLTHPDDLDLDLALVDQLLRGETSTYQMEKRYVRKDGRILWALLDVVLVRDEAGAPEIFISQVIDITARKAEEQVVQETLRENARRLAAFEERKREADILRNQLFTVCAWTKRIFCEGKWISTDEFLSRHLHLKLTHSISDEALEDVLGEMERDGGLGRSGEGQSP